MAKISEDNNFTSIISDWPYTYSVNGVDQKVLTINITSAPENSKVKVVRILDIGSLITDKSIPLTVGENVIQVPAGKLDRTVCFQFSNGDIEFDSLTLT